MTTRWIPLFLFLALGATAARAEDSPATPRHGGRIVTSDAGRFEIACNPATGTVTLYSVPDAGKSTRLAKAPLLEIQEGDGSRRITLAPVAGDPEAWTVTDPALKAAEVRAQVVVEREGRATLLDLRPAKRCHTLLLLGGDTLRLSVEYVPTEERLTLRPFTPRDATLMGRTAPEVVVRKNGTESVVLLTRLSGEDPAWELKDLAPLKSGSARVRVRRGEESLEATIRVPANDTEGLHGGRIVTFGSDDTRFEVVREPAAGRMVLYAMPSKDDRMKSLDAPPELSLSTSPVKPLRFVAVRNCESAWLLQADELKTAAVEGTLRARVDKQLHEVALPANETAEAQPQPQKRAEAPPAPSPTSPAPVR